MRLGSTLLLTIREASFTYGASQSPTIAISCFYTRSTQAFHSGIICLSCPSTKGRLMSFIFLSCLHQSLPIGVRIQGFPCRHRHSLLAWYYRPPCRLISALSLANRRFTVYLHVLGSSDETLLLQVVMTVDILVLQSTFNLHTIRCFLYLICYLGVAVDDTPQGGNALDDDEQFLDYSHILTLPPLPTEFATRHPI